MMGYDYFSGSSNLTGPVSPLQLNPGWINYSIESSVDYYLQQKVPDSTLLLGLPYFGAIWTTKSKAIPDTVSSFLGYRPYSSAVSAGLDKFSGDSTSQSLYYAYLLKGDSVGTTYRQFWVDGVNSLGSKYDYVLKKKLGGIGIWALGFDNGSEDLWNLLETKFARPDSADSLHVHLPDTASNSSTVFDYIRKMPVAAGIVLFAALCTLLTVLIRVLTDSASVNQLKSKGLYYQLALACVLVSCFALFCFLWLGFKLSLGAIIVIASILLALALSFGIFNVFRDRNMP